MLSKMANQNSAIQQLLFAEKKASEKVNEAKNRRLRRIKQAKEEAREEVERYRAEREEMFKEEEAKHLGSRCIIAAKIDKDTDVEIAKIQDMVNHNRESVMSGLIDLVFDVKPKLHENLRFKSKSN